MEWEDAVWLLVVAPVVVAIAMFFKLLPAWHRARYTDNRIASVEIKSAVPFHYIGSTTMLQGEDFKFTVVCKNKHGVVVPATDVTVAASPTTLGTVVVVADGSAGVFTAAVDQVGPVSLMATAAGVPSPAYPLTVEADVVVSTVEIVPTV